MAWNLGRFQLAPLIPNSQDYAQLLMRQSLSSMPVHPPWVPKPGDTLPTGGDPYLKHQDTDWRTLLSEMYPIDIGFSTHVDRARPSMVNATVPQELLDALRQPRINPGSAGLPPLDLGHEAQTLFPGRMINTGLAGQPGRTTAQTPIAELMQKIVSGYTPMPDILRQNKLPSRPGDNPDDSFPGEYDRRESVPGINFPLKEGEFFVPGAAHPNPTVAEFLKQLGNATSENPFPNQTIPGPLGEGEVSYPTQILPTQVMNDPQLKAAAEKLGYASSHPLTLMMNNIQRGRAGFSDQLASRLGQFMDEPPTWYTPKSEMAFWHGIAADPNPTDFGAYGHSMVADENADVSEHLTRLISNIDRRPIPKPTVAKAFLNQASGEIPILNMFREYFFKAIDTGRYDFVRTQLSNLVHSETSPVTKEGRQLVEEAIKNLQTSSQPLFRPGEPQGN